MSAHSPHTYGGKMQKCLRLYSHKKSHDTLSVVCLRSGPYHLALTSRKGSPRQQLSAPFSLSACILKTALIGSHSLPALFSSVPFVHSTTLSLLTRHIIAFFLYSMSWQSFPLVTELPVWQNLFFVISFLILSYSFLPRQEESYLSRGVILGTMSIKARLTTEI